MTKWYEVVTVTTKVYAVEVDDSEDALSAQDYALDEEGLTGNTEIRECRLVTDELEIDTMKRHADEVLEAIEL